jgi:hypothetical protein
MSAPSSSTSSTSASSSVPAITASADALDAPVEDLGEVVLVAPGGSRFTIPRASFEYSPALGLLTMYGDEKATEFDLKEKLNIRAGNPQAEAHEGKSSHVLFGIDDKYFKILTDFLIQYHKDKGVMPVIQDRCTMFKAECVAPKDYWPLVKDQTLDEMMTLDLLALFFGIDALRLVNELAVAFWIKDNPDKIAENKHLLEPMIERDVRAKEALDKKEKEEDRRAEESKKITDDSASRS